MIESPTDGLVDRRVWTGVCGFDQVNRSHQFTAPDPASFKLGRQSTTVEHIRLRRWSLPSLSGRRDPLPDPWSTTIIAVTEGSIRYTSETCDSDAVTGSVHILQEDDPIWFSTVGGADVLEIQIPEAIAGRSGRDRPPRAVTPIPATPGELALVSLALYTLDSAHGRSTTVMRAIAPLCAAVLDMHLPPSRPASLRDELLRYIDAHLHEPDLGPESIARAFGISLRWVHRVFTIDTETIARYVRRRRVQLVKDRLTASAHPPTLKILAEDSGFKSRETLAKSFKAETSLTVHEYAATHGANEMHRDGRPRR